MKRLTVINDYFIIIFNIDGHSDDATAVAGVDGRDIDYTMIVAWQ